MFRLQSCPEDDTILSSEHIVSSSVIWCICEPALIVGKPFLLAQERFCFIVLKNMFRKHPSYYPSFFLYFILKRRSGLNIHCLFAFLISSFNLSLSHSFTPRAAASSIACCVKYLFVITTAISL